MSKRVWCAGCEATEEFADENTTTFISYPSAIGSTGWDVCIHKLYEIVQDLIVHPDYRLAARYIGNRLDGYDE